MTVETQPPIIQQQEKRAIIPNNALPWVLPTGLIIVVLLVLEGLTAIEVIPSRVFPPPSEVGFSMADVILRSQFWQALGSTVFTSLIGLLVSIAVGIPLGILLGLNAKYHASGRFIIDFMRTIPPLAILPLAVLLLGTGAEMVITLIFLATVWPILIQAIAGVEGVEPRLLDMAKTYQFSVFKRWTQVVLPAASPFMMTGIRIAATISLLIAIGTELIVGSPGLGQLISRSQMSSLSDMYAYIVYAGLLGLALAGIISMFERKLLHWHESVRGDTEQ